MKRSTRWQHTCLSLLLGGLLAGQSVADQQPLDARASDPNVMGWMQGFPPAADKQINARNYLLFPQTRWSFSHIRQLLPTATVGAAPVPSAHCPTPAGMTLTRCSSSWPTARR